MADEARVLETVERYFEYVGADVERAAEIYHQDAVLEFPQSGERAKASRPLPSGGDSIPLNWTKCATSCGVSPSAPTLRLLS